MMLDLTGRRDATQDQKKKPIDQRWLSRQDKRVLQATEEAPNPTQTQNLGFQLCLSARQVRNARRLAVLKRDHPEEYTALMDKFRSKGGA